MWSITYVRVESTSRVARPNGQAVFLKPTRNSSLFVRCERRSLIDEGAALRTRVTQITMSLMYIFDNFDNSFMNTIGVRRSIPVGYLFFSPLSLCNPKPMSLPSGPSERYDRKVASNARIFSRGRRARLHEVSSRDVS